MKLKLILIYLIVTNESIDDKKMLMNLYNNK